MILVISKYNDDVLRHGFVSRLNFVIFFVSDISSEGFYCPSLANLTTFYLVLILCNIGDVRADSSPVGSRLDENLTGIIDNFLYKAYCSSRLYPALYVMEWCFEAVLRDPLE
jgi:hypothetical protein